MSPRGDETLLEDHNTITNSDKAEDEEDESLSLSDLPINQSTKTPSSLDLESAAPHQQQQEEDFEFGLTGGGGGSGSGSGSVLTESELCAADDVFFQGQILPLRFSVSSDNGFSCRNPSRCGSRSDSMEEHCSSQSGLTSLSSRSSSIKSHQSSSSSSTTTTTTTSYYKPKLVKNNFHSHPSPKPQIVSKNSARNHVRIGKSTTWGLLRVGLVRTPEIELQDLKLRNKSFSSSSSSSSTNGRKNDHEINGSKRFEEKKKKMMIQRFLFESCKCSVDAAVESVSSRSVINGVNKKKSSSSSTHEKKEIKKGGELVKEEVEQEEEEEEEEEKQQGKQKALNHRRTFEWLKELSIADVPTDEASYCCKTFQGQKK